MRALRMHGRLCFATSRRWCFLTLRPGREPVSALVEAFLETWQLDRTSTQWPTRRNEWVDALVAGRLAVRDLLDQTEHRHAQLQGSKPPAFLLYSIKAKSCTCAPRSGNGGGFPNCSH